MDAKFAYPCNHDINNDLQLHLTLSSLIHSFVRSFTHSFIQSFLLLFFINNPIKDFLIPSTTGHVMLVVTVLHKRQASDASPSLMGGNPFSCDMFLGQAILPLQTLFSHAIKERDWQLDLSYAEVWYGLVWYGDCMAPSLTSPLFSRSNPKTKPKIKTILFFLSSPHMFHPNIHTCGTFIHDMPFRHLKTSTPPKKIIPMDSYQSEVKFDMVDNYQPRGTVRVVVRPCPTLYSIASACYGPLADVWARKAVHHSTGSGALTTKPYEVGRQIRWFLCLADDQLHVFRKEREVKPKHVVSVSEFASIQRFDRLRLVVITLLDRDKTRLPLAFCSLKEAKDWFLVFVLAMSRVRRVGNVGRFMLKVLADKALWVTGALVTPAMLSTIGAPTRRRAIKANLRGGGEGGGEGLGLG